jgi:hypothetical protein
MWVVGAVGLLLGGCMLLVSAVITPQMLAATGRAQQIEQMESQIGMSARSLYLILGVVFTSPALVIFVLAFFVRRGGRGAVSTALVFVGLLAAVVAIVLVQGVITVLMGGGPPEALVGVALYAVVLGVLAWQCKWLFQALQAAPEVAATREQMRALEMSSQERYRNEPPAAPPMPNAFAYGQLPQGPPPPQARFPQPGFYHLTYLQPSQTPPGYDQPGSGPVGYGYAQAPRPTDTPQPTPSSPNATTGEPGSSA